MLTSPNAIEPFHSARGIGTSLSKRHARPTSWRPPDYLDRLFRSSRSAATQSSKWPSVTAAATQVALIRSLGDLVVARRVRRVANPFRRVVGDGELHLFGRGGCAGSHERRVGCRPPGDVATHERLRPVSPVLLDVVSSVVFFFAMSETLELATMCVRNMSRDILPSPRRPG